MEPGRIACPLAAVEAWKLGLCHFTHHALAPGKPSEGQGFCCVWGGRGHCSGHSRLPVADCGTVVGHQKPSVIKTLYLPPRWWCGQAGPSRRACQTTGSWTLRRCRSLWPAQSPMALLHHGRQTASWLVKTLPRSRRLMRRYSAAAN